MTAGAPEGSPRSARRARDARRTVTAFEVEVGAPATDEVAAPPNESPNGSSHGPRPGTPGDASSSLPTSPSALALLPVRPPPLADELLSSWLVRLAEANALKLHPFGTRALSGHALWNRDIDRSAPDALLAVLAARTGVSFERARATRLAAYAGVLAPIVSARGPTRWVLAAGVYHRTRRRYGLQACPSCLADDAVPYFRRAWRLACVTACVAHDRPLVDRCPCCTAPLQLHRGELGSRARHVPRPITACAACGRDLRRAPSTPLAPGELDAQRDVASAVGGTPVHLGAPVGVGAAPSDAAWATVEYFALLRQFTRLALGTGSGRLAGALRVWPPTAGLPWPPRDDPVRAEPEMLPLDVRRPAVAAAALLLATGLDDAMAYCIASAVWSADLLREMPDAPPAFRARVMAEAYRPLPRGRWTGVARPPA